MFFKERIFHMSKTVVLAEKPSVGRDIARLLNYSIKGNGLMEGSKYIVTWALGHLVPLADPLVYDEKDTMWKLHELPILLQNYKLVVRQITDQQFNALKPQL